jgi:hypothetical protein
VSTRCPQEGRVARLAAAEGHCNREVPSTCSSPSAAWRPICCTSSRGSGSPAAPRSPPADHRHCIARTSATRSPHQLGTCRKAVPPNGCDQPRPETRQI